MESPDKKLLSISGLLRGFLLSTLFIIALKVITHLLQHPVSMVTWIFCWVVLFLYFTFKSNLKDILKKAMLPK